MFAIGNFLIALTGLIGIISRLLSIYIYVIIFKALISWVNPDPYNPIVQFLHRSTEPVLSPIRFWMIRLFRKELWLDISPMVAIVAIMMLQAVLGQFVSPTLYGAGKRLKGDNLVAESTVPLKKVIKNPDGSFTIYLEDEQISE